MTGNPLADDPVGRGQFYDGTAGLGAYRVYGLGLIGFMGFMV